MKTRIIYFQSIIIIYFIYFPRNTSVDMKSNQISYSSLLYCGGSATDSSFFVEDLVDRLDDATEVVSAKSVFLLVALVGRRVEEELLDVSFISSPSAQQAWWSLLLNAARLFMYEFLCRHR